MYTSVYWKYSNSDTSICGWNVSFCNSNDLRWISNVQICSWNVTFSGSDVQICWGPFYNCQLCEPYLLSKRNTPNNFWSLEEMIYMPQFYPRVKGGQEDKIFQPIFDLFRKCIIRHTFKCGTLHASYYTSTLAIITELIIYRYR